MFKGLLGGILGTIGLFTSIKGIKKWYEGKLEVAYKKGYVDAAKEFESIYILVKKVEDQRKDKKANKKHIFFKRNKKEST